jgi:hypothetical protein
MDLNIKLPMTVEAARKVQWPYKPYAGQEMGPLFDEDIINYKDLGYAVHRATAEVRYAAQTFILYYLSQQSSKTHRSVNPPQLLEGDDRSFVERRQMQLATLGGVIAGFILTSFFFLFILSVINAFQDRSADNQAMTETPDLAVRLIALLIIGLFLGLGYFFFTKGIDLIYSRLERQIQFYRQGQRGEERCLNTLYKVLDENWWILRNLQLPKAREDMDFILLGKPGVWCLEVKSYTGQYKVDGEKWYKKSRSGWWRIPKDPGSQARANAAKLSAFLGAKGIKQWVNPVVIWANPDAPLDLTAASIEVWQLTDLGSKLLLPAKRPLSEEQKQAIWEELRVLYSS